MTQIAVPPRVVLPSAADAEEDGFPVAGPSPYFPLLLHIPEGLRWDEEQFRTFCQQNETLRIERNAEGDLVIMPPAGGETGSRNFRLNVRFGNWAEQDGRGEG